MYWQDLKAAASYRRMEAKHNISPPLNNFSKISTSIESGERERERNENQALLQTVREQKMNVS